MTGIAIDIPGYRQLHIRTIVSDYTGTLSCAGSLVPGVEQRLQALAGLVDLHIVTSDTFGTAKRELQNVPCAFHLLSGTDHDVQKRDYVLGVCDPAKAVAFGNGRNDVLLLGAVRSAGGLAIAVDNGEGCAIEALQNADIFIAGAQNALDLLLDTRRCVATLRS